jgi:uncharacterized protein (TIGR00255 family)
MTGHGRGVAEVAGRRVTVELRAVNHRFFEVKLRAAVDPRVEEALGAALRRRLERGSLSVAVRDEPTGGRAGGYRVDVELARSVHAALDEARRAIGSNDPVPLALVLAQPGVVAAQDSAVDPEASLAALLPALDAALDELVAMRRREGAALAADLGARLARLEGLAAEIRGLAVDAPGELRRRLDERIAKLGVNLDEQRLAVEVALLADRVDVTEELVRLGAHLAAARAHLVEDAPVGRRLDFLVQELGREINTIGSKSQLVDISRRVVEAKAELERIREQVQNIE